MIPQYEPGARASRTITLITHNTKLEIAKSGVYRVNVTAGRVPEFLIYEGEGRLAGRDVKAPSIRVNSIPGRGRIEFYA